MKTIAIVLTGLTLATLFAVSEERRSVKLSSEDAPYAKAVKTPLDFSKHLYDPAQWKMGPAGTLTLSMQGDSTLFLLNGQSEVFRLQSPEYINEAVVSDDGTALMFLVWKSEGFGSNYATLVEVQQTASGVKVNRVLESGEKLFEKRWWVSQLGAVSNDGKRVLAQFAIQSQSPERGRVKRQWFTVDVGSGKILSEGLTMENGKGQEKN